MNVLIACEFSGVVRDAFIAEGHDAVSCDLLPTESPGPHIQGNLRYVLDFPWDMMIAFPPCTYLCNSGVRWLYEKPGRMQLMWEAAWFFLDLLGADIPRIAVENPVMHGHTGIRKPDFTIQPWQFGDPYKKRTCFWTKNLPPLKPTNVLDPADAEAAVHLASPGPDRWKKRSITYPGPAKAMAKQWGALG